MSVVQSRASILAIVAAIVIAAGLLALSRDVNSPPPALAGPCAAPPELFLPDDNVNTDEPFESVSLFTAAGETRSRVYHIETHPDTPPPNKPQPYATVEITADPGDPGIDASFTPDSSGAAFDAELIVTVDPDTPPGVYHYVIKMTCHPTDPVTGEVDAFIYVDTCPVDGVLPAGPATATPQPFPNDCTTTTTPTTVGTATPIPTPSPRPGNALWGDVDCPAHDVNAEDALMILKEVAGLNTPTPSPSPSPAPQPCFLWKVLVKIAEIFQRLPAGEQQTVQFGDFNCSGEADAGDALTITRYAAGFTDELPAGCPPIGAAVQLELAP